MSDAWVKHAGSWKQATTWVKHADTWKQPTTWVRRAGTWVPLTDVVEGGGVAFDAASNSGPQNAVASASWTHTPVGTPTAVAVTVSMYNGGGPTAPTVTYGGEAMALEDGVASPDGTTGAHIFGLADPLPGAQTVLVTFAAGGTYSICGCVSVTGSDTAQCFRDSATAAGPVGSTTASVSVPSAADDLVVDALAYWAVTGSPVIGAGQTSRYNNNTFGLHHASSTEPGSGASVTMSWTDATGGVYAIVGASFKKA